MTNPGFRVTRPAIDRFTIELVGTIDEETAMRCERETRMQLSLVPESSLHVLWDLSAVRGYSFEARVVIVRLQRYLTKKADRTVYLAADSAPRSLALWAARMGNDARACIAADLDSAEAWLAGRGEPNTLVRPISSVRTAVASKTRAAN